MGITIVILGGAPTKRDDILRAAETVWDEEGFTAPGMDRIIQAAHTTPRTLYRHFHSKEALVEAVLAARQERYRSLLMTTARCGDSPTATVVGVFDALQEWLRTESTRGCLFLRALSEWGLRNRSIAETVRRYKREILGDLRIIVAQAGLDPKGELPDQLVLLIEGATAVATVMGAEQACRKARAVVETLLS